MRLLVLALAAAGCASSTPTPAPPPPPAPPAAGVDFHMHLNPGSEHDAAAARAALDEAGLARGCVLSPGYHRPDGCEFGRCEGQRAYTVEMNDLVVAAAAKTSGRLLPFCGVPIREPWAAEEVVRCRQRGARGIKMHQVRDDVSFADDAIADRFVAVLEAAAAADVPVLIHVKMDDAAEVRAFFAVVARVPEARVIAAHQIAPSFALLPEAPENLWVEISGLTHAPAAAGAAFVPVWRAMGIERVLLGSDWPTLGPKAHVEMLEKYPLEPDELEAILRTNAAVVLSARSSD